MSRICAEPWPRRRDERRSRQARGRPRGRAQPPSVAQRLAALALTLSPVLPVTPILPGAGCYRHVVREEGLGSSGSDVHEPNVADNKGVLEEIFNEQDRTRRDK